MLAANEPKIVDVVIAGGGPAGCAAALTLLRHTGLSVMLVEQTGYGQDKVGETLSPAVLPLLDYLGVGEHFRQGNFAPSHAFTAAWGDAQVSTRDFLFTGRGHGWHLDRARFDAGLANAARSFGAHLVLGARVRQVHRQASGWTVKLDNEPDQPIWCRYLIDASGRSAWLGRALDAKTVQHDRLVGVSAYFAASDTPVESSSLVEAISLGWWYSAPIPDGRTIAVLMTDADVLQASHCDRSMLWKSALAQAPNTRLRLGERPLTGELHVWPAHSQQLQPNCGNGWVAAGDAAAAFDPLSSMGIGYALSTGIHAARLAASCIDRPQDHALQQAAYADDIQRHVEEYQTLKRSYYNVETRYSDQPFWARRQGNAEVI